MIPNPTLETRDLRLVQAIAEAGGATKAARLLHVSQSAISHQLKGLERRLGVAVFERAGRKLRITPAGERLASLSREVLPPLAEAELVIRREKAASRPMLRITTQCYTAYHWLPQAWAALSSRHPEVDLAIVQDDEGEVPAAFEANRIDLALCCTLVGDRSLERKRLFDDELVLAIHRGHPLSRRKFIDGRDLLKETLILPGVSRSQRELVKKALFPHGGGFARVVRVPVTEGALHLVLAKAGVTIMSRFMMQPYWERGEIETVRLTARGIRRTWTAVYRKRSPLEVPIATLLEAVRDQAPPR